MDERKVLASVYDFLDNFLLNSRGEWFVHDREGVEQEYVAEVSMLDGSDRFSMEIDGESFVFTVTKEG